MILSFKDPEYNLMFYIIIVDNQSELLQLDRDNLDFDISSALEEESQADAIVLSDIKNQTDVKSIIVCFKPKYVKCEIKYFLRVASHECVHATFRRFGDLGLEDKIQNQDEFAKYFEWLYGKVLEYLWKYRQ